MIRWLLPLICLFGAGCIPVAVAGASQGINYTFTSVAFRSFTAGETQVHAAVNQALARMQISKLKDEKAGEGFRIDGKTEKLKIVVKIEPVTKKVTKVSVNASRYVILRDKTVAVEILMQTAKILGAP